MNLQSSSGDYLRTIGSSCTNLLYALHQSPEEVLGQIFRIESACQSYVKTSRVSRDHADECSKMISLVGVLHGQMGTKGLMDDQDFTAFRERVLAIQSCAKTLQNSMERQQPRP